MTLASELATTVATVKAAVPDHIFSQIVRSIQDLDASGLARHAANVGSSIPLAHLTDTDGKRLNLGSLAARGPVVLIFYRGGWCPYCNVTLRAFARALPDFAARGANIVAITPELPANAAETVERNDLGFPVVIDEGNAFARELGLVFALPEALRPLYREIGIKLDDWNGDASHELPLAATYVIDAEGKVLWAHVEADFTTRAEPADVLAALARIS